MRVIISPLLGILLSVVLVGCNDNDDKKPSSSSSSNASTTLTSSSITTAVSSTPASISSDASSAMSAAINSSIAPSSAAIVNSSTAAINSSEALPSSTAASLSSSSIAASSAPADVSLTGTAAVGAAIVNGVVTAKCASGNGFSQVVTTNNQGAFSGSLPATSFPCALQISGGMPAITLHSYAVVAGTINITPFTDLIIANASTMTPSTWFQSDNWNILDLQLQTAVNNLKTSLTNSGYSVPIGTFDPLTISFQIGDAWDQLLDQLQAAISVSSTLSSYIDLLNLVKDGSFAVLPPKTSGGSGGSGTGNAASCFNADLAKQGTKIQLNYKSTDGQSGAIINTAASIDVNGKVTFNGTSAIESVSQTQATGTAPSTSTTKSYLSVDAGAKSFSYYGSVVDVSAPVALTTTITINPARLERFDLNAGESYSQNYSLTSTVQVLGFPVNTVTDFSSTVTFKGIETVTVPAGSFSACRIETNDNNGISTSWFSVNTGISIKTESGGDISELTSGSINGISM